MQSIHEKFVNLKSVVEFLSLEVKKNRYIWLIMVTYDIHMIDKGNIQYDIIQILTMNCTFDDYNTVLINQILPKRFCIRLVGSRWHIWDFT